MFPGFVPDLRIVHSDNRFHSILQDQFSLLQDLLFDPFLIVQKALAPEHFEAFLEPSMLFFQISELMVLSGQFLMDFRQIPLHSFFTQ